MAAGKFIVRPITRGEAVEICAAHPHAHSLPNSSRYYMRLDIDGRLAGLAIWGWGLRPVDTAKHLFGEGFGVRDYLELCRFFVFDWCPKNTASRFLATTHRIIRKYAPWVKVLYTYAAGFQGLIGYIYKAAGYDYLGRQKTDALLWIPKIGMVHRVSLFNRYGKGTTSARFWRGVFPGAVQWCGYNFRYLYWLCDKATKADLLARAKFEIIRPYPTEADLEIWTVDADGVRSEVTPAFAKTIPIVKLPTKRAGSVAGDTPANHAGEGGSTPTPALT